MKKFKSSNAKKEKVKRVFFPLQLITESDQRREKE